MLRVVKNFKTMDYKNYLKISLIIPTRNRSKNLIDLLLTILDQNYPLFEVIIVDDSDNDSTRYAIERFKPKLKEIGCNLKYVRGRGDGLPAARNLGVKISEGDAILFLDDDVLLDKNAVRALASFLEKNSKSLGVQPIILPTMKMEENRLLMKFLNAIYRVLMLTYWVKNKQAIRRSGMDIFPSALTRVINVQRLLGSCFCFKRKVFENLKFDENLKRWGFMEDLDFSHRLYKKYPQSLYAIPDAKVIHKRSLKGRLSPRLKVHMEIIYWFYIFFKDIFEGSLLNLLAFLWALLGNLAVTIALSLIKGKAEHAWNLIYLLESYTLALKNLKRILSSNLNFFNRKLINSQ